MAAGIGFLLALAASVLGCGLALRWLRRNAVLDLPNERSSHSVPTPRGGGLAVVPAALLVWAGLDAVHQTPAGSGVVAALAAALALVSWRDDRAGLPPLQRLAAHAAAVLAGLLALPAGALVFQGLLPFWLDRAAVFVAWVWLVNLTNFMDGIDGITGIEVTAVTLGLAIVAAIGRGFAAPDLAVAGAALGFLYWNWSPARLFMGDAGSVPLGYLMGWLLVQAALGGAWAAAIILPLYYWADATITLLRRALRGERLWVAHREHFYQQAVRRGAGHGAVALRVLFVDGLLVAAAIASRAHPGEALASAVAVVALLLWSLARWPVSPA